MSAARGPLKQDERLQCVRKILAVLVATVSLTVGAVTHAQSSSREYTFDIQQMAITPALHEFSRRTGLQFGYLPDTPGEEDQLVGPLKGRYTAQAALTELLRPAGLSFRWINTRTFLVFYPATHPRAGETGEQIVAGDKPYASKEEIERLIRAGGGLSGSARGPGMEEVTVTGSRLDMYGLEAPVVVVDTDEIQRSSASSVSDLLKRVTQIPYTRPQWFRADGAQFAELRGLGPNMAVVLIDGRRVIPTASALQVDAFDLNDIPLPAVDRVEVLSDSASAVYGADAVAGVLNVLLKRNISGPQFDYSYGAADDGANENRASLSLGGVAGRARGSLVLDYFSREPLLGVERERWRNQDFRRFGSIDWRSPIASPGNITSALPGNLPALPSPIAAVPQGISGRQLTPGDLLQTAGETNLTSLLRSWSIVSETERRGIVGQGEIAIVPHLTVFADVLVSESSKLNQSDYPALTGALVAGTQAHNPFDAPVIVDVLLTGLPETAVSTESKLRRVVAGLRGDLNGWSWDVSFVHSDDRSLSLLRNQLDRARVAAALESPDPAQALNVFEDGPGGSPELLAALIAEPQSARQRSRGRQALGYLQGPLFTIGEETVNAVLGVEWRQEHVFYDIEERFDVPALFGSHERTVSAAFAELGLPLMNPSMEVPGVHDLTVSLAARFDDYTTLGGTFNPQYSLTWRPVADVSLRGSYSTSFRPPSLFELFAPRVIVTAPIPDLRRNNAPALARIIAGGNPALEPTHADAITTGITWNPLSWPDLRMRASYWRIELDDRISLFGVLQMLANETQFADRIVRAEPSAEDVAAGRPGPLTAVDIRRINSGSLKASGIDFSVEHVFRTALGNFSPALSATWMRTYETADIPGGPTRNRVDIADSLGTIPKWRVVANLDWERNGLGVSATATYLPAYRDSSLIDGRPNGRTIASQALIDAQAWMDLGRIMGSSALSRGLVLRAGVSNLLDDEPPFAESGGLHGIDISQGDLRQRFGYVKISKSF
jgi:iron complex outermembrane recepter protein